MVGAHQRRRAGSMSAEERSGHAIAGCYAELLDGARNHFQHAADRSAGRNEIIGKRFGVLDNVQDASVAGDKDHIQRDVGVVHPEGHRLIALEVEQHTLSLGQRFAEHEAALPFRTGGGKFDIEGVHAAA